MSKNLDSKKLKLIKIIMSIGEENLLDKIDYNIYESQNGHTAILEKVVQPTKKSISIEEMIKEQNYTPISADEFFQLAGQLEIEESLENLLAQLD